MTYGIGYMGSKSKIADWVLSYIPNADNFYDLCAGGCAMTHAAMLSHKFKNFIINDIQGDVPQLFVDAINGKYRNETRWISREDFFKLKDTDAYVRCVWSFGNRGATYIYGKSVEPYKRALHKAIVFCEFDDMLNYGFDLSRLKQISGIHNRRIEFKKILNEYSKRGIVERKDSHYKFNNMLNFVQLQSLERLQRLQSLESLERLERLNRLQSLESPQSNITLYKGSYNDVPIKENSVLYCDIPYRKAETYQCEEFDYNMFYNWCARQKELVIVSEYNMPQDKFYCIAEKEVRSTLSSTSNSTEATERLFIPIHQKDMYYSRINSNKIQLSLF